MNHDKSDTAQPVAGTDAVVQPWVDYWMKQYEQNTQLTQALMAGVPPQVEPEAIRKEWLGTMSKSIEAFMRTPTFLEGMRQNSEAITATKITSELAKQELARQAGVPHIQDISGLYDRLETAHEVLLQRLQKIEDRLTGIESKLDEKPASPAKKKNASSRGSKATD
jgi:hypothetical protein